MAVLMTFSAAFNFMLTYWLGGSEKVQKCADVIYGWSLEMIGFTMSIKLV